MAPVGALGRRGQAEAKRRHAGARRQRVGRPRQVVALVEHHQPEAVAEVLHVQVGGVVGRHGQRAHVVLAAADDADRDAERRAQDVVPLAHEIERRGDDQRAAPLVLDGEAGDPGLARARRQHDDAAALVGPPGRQRLGLVGARLAVDARAQLELAVAARAILDGAVGAAERAPHRRVRGRGRAEAGRARVPQAFGRRGRAGRQARDLDRAASKRERGQRGNWQGRHGRSLILSITRPPSRAVGIA